MKELVEHMAKSLVANPEAVIVSEKINGDSLELTLKVAQDDMGKVIGKQGRIAKAMRAVLKAAAAKEGKKCNLDID
ncbi:MAG: KH domain-containing protein [Clostridiales bacterium]|nr:KH domain-containing protein [Clostridiales bacterium]